MNRDYFDSGKRRTLKILAGLTSTTLITSLPASAGSFAALSTQNAQGEILNCTLISRADISRTHLLMHNTTDAHITVSSFLPQLIEYDNTLMNLESAYRETVVIPPNDRVMVRLNTETGLSKKTPYKNVINLNNTTKYLPQGTRVVDLPVNVVDGVCTIGNASLLT